MDALERTLALIKPDAVRFAAEIADLATEAGFTVICRRTVQLTEDMAAAFYREHEGKPFHKNLIEFMSSGHTCALALAKVNAIKDWRELAGPTNAIAARALRPKSLRALYGQDGTRNAIHGSDSPHSAAIELRFFFPELQACSLPSTADLEEYMEKHLTPVVSRGLIELVRLKPTSQPLECTTWLARWMLEHNPNKPQMICPGPIAGRL